MSSVIQYQWPPGHCMVAASLRIWGLTPYAVDASGFDVKDTWKLVRWIFYCMDNPLWLITLHARFHPKKWNWKLFATVFHTHVCVVAFTLLFYCLALPMVKLIDPSSIASGSGHLWNGFYCDKERSWFWGSNFAIFISFHVPFEGRLQCNWFCMPFCMAPNHHFKSW